MVIPHFYMGRQESPCTNGDSPLLHGDDYESVPITNGDSPFLHGNAGIPILKWWIPITTWGYLWIGTHLYMGMRESPCTNGESPLLHGDNYESVPIYKRGFPISTWVCRNPHVQMGIPCFYMGIIMNRSPFTNGDSPFLHGYAGIPM